MINIDELPPHRVVVARTDVATLLDVQRSRLRLADAIARGLLVLDGDAILARDLPTWGGSPPLAAPPGVDCPPSPAVFSRMRAG